MIGKHLHPRKKCKLRCVGICRRFKRIEIIPSGFVAQEVTAYASGAGGNNTVIAEKLKYRICAEPQLSPNNLLRKGVCFLEFCNSIVVCFILVEAAENGGLLTFIKLIMSYNCRLFNPILP